VYVDHENQSFGLAMYREITSACSEIHTSHRNTLCAQDVKFMNAEPGGTCSKHWALCS